MKKFFQDDEQDLIAFLHQHRPLPPKQNSHLESHLMELVNQTSQRNSPENHLKLITAFSGTIVLGLAVLWSGSRWSQQTQKIAVDQGMVEAFLLNSWENTVNEHTVFFSNEQEADWFFSHTEKSPQVLSHSQ
ncbi:hypothetical protein Xen7305DRAFT_00010150 [Xenococcus sp. PCC 7305]|uniref:hypothetical protein n=1 Tax=Xenococcus sp. PCC 7305 TaxID=102125 RepID=UPI0002AD05AA|nr:hypothetical protein [Xenococcus sp. PCC 7305]ELS01312.1 hypothetical protein Xen7305DRAFT_00010150 [Xenococcus sp. PCC 7305]